MVKDVKNTKTKQGVDTSNTPKAEKKGKKTISSKPKAVSVKSKDIVKKPKMSNRFNKLRLTKGSSSGIIYIGHLPQGFTEEELKGFFKQFGQISKIRVSRSKKTGRSKGYAFLQFKDKEVAEIAAKTMDGYLMFGKKIECHIQENAHKDTFKNGNRTWSFVPH